MTIAYYIAYGGNGCLMATGKLSIAANKKLIIYTAEELIGFLDSDE